MKRITPIVLVGALLAMGTGCCELNNLVYRPFGKRMICDMDHCTDGCGPTFPDDCGSACETSCGPICGSGCGSLQTGCGTTHGEIYKPMAASCCPTCGLSAQGSCGPIFSRIFRLLNPESWCGDTCGEKYWGDFYGDPPDCCDPCNLHGNFTNLHVGYESLCTNGCGGGCTGGSGCGTVRESGCTNGCESGFSDGGIRGDGGGCDCGMNASRNTPTVVTRSERGKPAYRSAMTRNTARW